MNKTMLWHNEIEHVDLEVTVTKGMENLQVDLTP